MHRSRPSASDWLDAGGRRGLRKLFDNQEIANSHGVNASAIETADGFAGIGHKRLTEQIEGRIDENGCGRALAELVEQAPEARIGSRSTE